MGIGKTNAMPTLAVTDLETAKEFYGDLLGFEEVRSFVPDEKDVLYRVGPESYVYVYERSTPAGSTATVCAFPVEDVEATVEALREKGAKFEEYDIPELDLKTVGGIADMGGVKSAWLTDPSGNIVAIDDSLAVLRRLEEEDRAEAEAEAGA